MTAVLVLGSIVLGLSSSTSGAAGGSPHAQGPPPSAPVLVRAAHGPHTTSNGTGRPPAAYPAAPTAAGVQPTATTASGDQLSVQTTFPAAAFSDPSSSTGYSITCSGNGPVYGNELIGFCGYVQVYDSTTGAQTTENNTQTDDIYDACGAHVGSGSSYGWHVVGTSYFATSWVGSQLFTVPTSGVCWGTWSETYTFTQTFNDGQTLTASATDSFAAYPVAPAPETAYGVGNGNASTWNPICQGGDPVNCASGNFSETFTDAIVPGRGPGLDLKRTYNSLSASAPGIFGYGWTSSYEAHLAMNSDGSATVFEDDGSQVTGVPGAGGTFTMPPWADSTLTQNADGSWAFVRRKATTFTFDAGGRLTAITDRNGYATRLTYNGSGQLSTVTDAAGRTLTFTFGTNGYVSQVTDPIGQVTRYAYDSAGDLTSVSDPMNRVTSFGYDANHLMLTMTDPNQGVTTNVYDPSGRVTQQTDPAGLVTTFAYSGDNFSTSGGTTTITDPHGAVDVENYTSGVLLSTTKGYGTAAAATWSYGYDSKTFGTTSITDPNGNVTTATYDSAGNILTSKDALGRTTTFTYNSLDEPLTVTDPLGIVTSYTYDAAGNMLTKTVTGVGGSPVQTWSYAYGDGNAGDITEVTDPAGHITDYAYDAQGDLTAVTTHPASGVDDTTESTYDTLGRKVCETSPNAVAAGNGCAPAGLRYAGTTTTTYDADSEPTSVTDPLGNVTSYSYDANGNVTEVDSPSGRRTLTTYDADSRKLTFVAGYGTAYPATTSYAYDVAPGNGACTDIGPQAAYCNETTDPSGETTVQWFDVRNELVQEERPGSGTRTSTYDPAGNLSSLTTSGGRADYGYDAAGELTSITYSNPATGYAAAANVTYAYDADGDRTSRTDGSGITTYAYDSLERLVSKTDGSGATVTYGYDLDNELTSIGYPGKGTTVGQTFDGAGRQSSLTDWLGNTTAFTYDANGNPTSSAYPNGTTVTSTYDATDHLLSTQDALTSALSSPFASFAYTYTMDSQLAGETATDVPGPPSQSYSYDEVGRVTSAGAASYAYSFSGDPAQLPAATQAFAPGHEVTSTTATITRVGTASAGDATSTSLTVNLPAGTAPSDQILLGVTLPGNQKVKSITRGYTLVGTYPAGTSASDVQLVLYRRTAQAGDTAVTVKFPRAFAKAATLVVYRGVDPVSPVDASSSGVTANGQSVVAPSVTATATGDELVLALAAASASAGTWTAPGGMTLEVGQNGGPTIDAAVADQALTASGATGTRTAGFSVTGSLAGALVALRPAQTSYAYDSLGDRTSIAGPSGTSTLAYDQLGELTAYGSTTYAYDADGLRTAKTTGNKTETFVWGTAGPGGNPRVLVDGGTDYLYGPDGMPLEQISGNKVLYYFHDRLGSTRVLTDPSGAVAATYSYDAFGNATGSTGSATNPFGFAGAYADSESGLLYLQHRYYDPSTAQFLTVDPIVDLTGAPYAYVGDDPLDGADPVGLCCGFVGWLGHEVMKHAEGISQVTGAVGAALTFTPAAPLAPVFDAVSVATGAIATQQHLARGEYGQALVSFGGTVLSVGGLAVERLAPGIDRAGQALNGEIDRLSGLVTASEDPLATSQFQAQLEALLRERRDFRLLSELRQAQGVRLDAYGVLASLTPDEVALLRKAACP